MWLCVCVCVCESRVVALCVSHVSGSVCVSMSCVCLCVPCVWHCVCGRILSVFSNIVPIVLYLMLYFIELNTTQPKAKGNIFISFLFLAIANCLRLVYASEKNFLSTAFQ